MIWNKNPLFWAIESMISILDVELVLGWVVLTFC